MICQCSHLWITLFHWGAYQEMLGVVVRWAPWGQNKRIWPGRMCLCFLTERWRASTRHVEGREMNTMANENFILLCFLKFDAGGIMGSNWTALLGTCTLVQDWIWVCNRIEFGCAIRLHVPIVRSFIATSGKYSCVHNYYVELALGGRRASNFLGKFSVDCEYLLSIVLLGEKRHFVLKPLGTCLRMSDQFVLFSPQNEKSKTKLSLSMDLFDGGWMRSTRGETRTSSVSPSRVVRNVQVDSGIQMRCTTISLKIRRTKVGF